MYLKTNALIIREVLLNEADKLLTLISDTLGLITVKAKGIVKITSKSSSACQVFTWSSFELYKKGDFYTLVEANQIRTFSSLQSDLKKMALASYLSEVTEQLYLSDSETDENLRLLLNLLYALDKDIADLEVIRAVFEIRSVKAAGYLQDVSRCQECDTELANKSVYFLDNGFVCKSCSEGYNNLLKIHSDVYNAILYIYQSDIKKILSFSIDINLISELNLISESLIRINLGCEKARNYYKEILHFGEHFI